MTTSSPASTVASSASKITCLPPLPTTIRSGAIVSPWSRRCRRAIAAFRSGVPSCGGYFVRPASAAACAASIACGGESKSGSPIVSCITSMPRARSSRARMVIAMVGAVTDRSDRAEKPGFKPGISAAPRRTP